MNQTNAPMHDYSTCVQHATYWERRIKYAFASRRNPRFREQVKFCTPKLRQWLIELQKHGCNWCFDLF